jgi:hypothetical protein
MKQAMMMIRMPQHSAMSGQAKVEWARWPQLEHQTAEALKRA